MLMTEYNEAETLELFKEEARQEGREEGIKEGREEGIKEGVISTLINLARDGLVSISEAASRANLSEAEFRNYLI